MAGEEIGVYMSLATIFGIVGYLTVVVIATVCTYAIVKVGGPG